MFDQEHLSLRLVRLKPLEEWANRGTGLSFVFSKGGAGKYVSGPITRSLASGDVLVLSGASGGRLCAADSREMTFWWFSACLEHLFPLLAGNEICLLQNVTDGFKNSRLYPASTPLAKECHKLLEDIAPHSDLAHRGQVLRVVAAILSEEFKVARGHRPGFGQPEEHMVQVFEKLSVTEILDLSVNDLAGKFGCSRRHLNRLFHQHFGFSVAALRMEMRLLKAVSLLRDPDAKVINVAEACGFNHLGLFNICFKRRFGASPGQYRKTSAPAATRNGGQFGKERTCPLQLNGLCPWTGGPGKASEMEQQTSPPQKSGPTSASARAQGAGLTAKPPTDATHQKIAPSLSRPNAPVEVA